MKLALLAVVGVLAFALVNAQRGRVKEIAFFQHPVCEGLHHKMSLGNGECKNLPEWISDWNLSVDPEGHCIRLYEGRNCAEVVAYSSIRKVSSQNEIRGRCKSTKHVGFKTVGSFKRC